MGWSISRSARISILLLIDLVFFFVELVSGYAVGSLALVADSFHMLNDILSLGVGLYAIKLTGQTIDDVDTKFSYGWHRAEILAALINGVFLLALCFSIFMEAIERFFSTPEISNPKLIVIVGSLGLMSNFVGLFLFHEHDHSHEHKHHSSKHDMTPGQLEQAGSAISSGSVTPTREDERGRSRERAGSVYGHPAAMRTYVLHQAEELQRARSPSPTRDVVPHSYNPERLGRFLGPKNLDDGSVESNSRSVSESTPLLGNHDIISAAQSSADLPASQNYRSHSGETKRSGGHSQGSMNMRALVLHVMGDALGNIGVIATGLVIWLTDLSWKYYFDPVISLVITCIIFSSALPLVKSASFILLQGVPSGISLQDVDEAIRGVDGVQDVHELHIWQLSESKVVASVHVLASRSHDFMQVATEIRSALHDRGIHSSTIQPEYHTTSRHVQTSSASDATALNGSCCLVVCPPGQKDCNPSEHSCCPPPPPPTV